VDLRWSWLVVLLAVAAGVALWLSLRNRREAAPTGLPVAHVARLRALPRFQQLARRELAWTVARLVAAAVVLIGSILLAARPTDAVTEDPAATPADLLLCLDITPGLHDADVTVLAQARRLVGSLDGERVGLYAFQGSTAELMPLTDDYGYARSRLHDAQTVIAGLDTGQSGFASAGDGLVSCAEHFDRPGDERGRAVVLLSANGPAASPIHTLVQAAEYAVEHDVVVYGVAPAIGGAARTDFATATELTGGRLLSLDGKDPLEQVRRLERDRLDPPAVPVRRDTPRGLTVVVLLGVAALLATGVRGLLR
jgi:Ca-activated chloride channel family protein